MSAARVTVAMLEEDGEQLYWIQSMVSGLDGDCAAPDAFCTALVREFPNYSSIRICRN